MSAAVSGVHLVFGPVGAGKSTYARALAVLDLGLMKAASRAEFRACAIEHGHPLKDHYVQAAAPVRAQRMRERNATRGETFSFEVAPMMFEFMEGYFEPPSPAELLGATVVSSAGHAPTSARPPGLSGQTFSNVAR